jgi:hypothetical protein
MGIRAGNYARFTARPPSTLTKRGEQACVADDDPDGDANPEGARAGRGAQARCVDVAPCATFGRMGVLVCERFARAAWRAIACGQLVALGLLGLVSGCAEQNVSLAGGPREYVAGDYPEVLKAWTRDKSFFSLAQLDERLTVTATFESWDFRWAYVVRYASDFRLTIEQRRELLDKTLAETRSEHEFYVALYGPNWRWTDLSRPTSEWVVRLIDDKGNETAPSRIEAIIKPGPLEYQYFPYTTPWRHAYRIQFPRTTSTGQPTISPDAIWFGLLFAGAEGNGDLIWRVAPGDESRAGLPSVSDVRSPPRAPTAADM